MSKIIYKAFYDKDNNLHYIKAIPTNKPHIGLLGITNDNIKIKCEKCGNIYWNSNPCDFCEYNNITEVSLDEINKLLSEKKEQENKEKQLEEINKQLEILNQKD